MNDWKSDTPEVGRGQSLRKHIIDEQKKNL